MRNALNSKLQEYTNEVFYDNDICRCTHCYIPGKQNKTNNEYSQPK